jgi:Ca-activated chloride channel family protein
MISDMHFMHPGLLWLLLLIIPLTVWHILKDRKSDPTLRIPTTQAFDSMPRSWKEWMRHVLFALEMLALACLVIILARPQSSNSWSKTDIEGTDIVLSLDVSGSMLARDFSPNRLEAAKDVATKFVSNRTSDNIGLVVFAGEAFTQVPMTNDIATLVNHIGELQIGMLEDGTAVGDGLATAINRIKDGKAKSKSIILLTDGSNNTGVVGPLTAAKIAAKYGIKVYAIGVGTMGEAPYPTLSIGGQITYTRQKVEIDEKSLQEIARITGGKYFRATSKSVLKDIFSEIDSLEKTRMDVQRHSQMDDNYQPWALALLFLLTLCAIIRYTVLRAIP